MPTAAILVFLGVLCRVVPHPPNAVAIGAIALYAGARLPRRWAWIVPVASMILADLILDWGSGRSWLSGSRLVGYAAYAAITLLGPLARHSSNPLRIAGLSISASLFFFVASNFSVWLFDGLYPLDAAGLSACFLAAIPYWGTGDYGFFANGILADLAGCGLLFGLDFAARAIRDRRRPALAVPASADAS
ncbi:MAG: DUF6580 family putative transport protein [Isosphaeraceae bacterium]|nr:DUF6580 family putative transport protein [Isosphaeraceae bacterium]